MEFLIIVVGLTALCLLVWYAQIRVKRFNDICGAARVLKGTAGAAGNFHKSPYSSRRDFLEYMGQFFKYKKHEWIFIAFMRDDIVDVFWVNKGPNRKCVSPFMSISDVVRICQEKGSNHILVGHNHPSGALAPSKQDRLSYELFMDSLAQVDVSLEDIVFVAGQWRNYGLSIGQHLRRLFGETR